MLAAVVAAAVGFATSPQPCLECSPPSSPTCPDPALAILLGESANATEQLQFMSNTESPSVNYIRSLTQIMAIGEHTASLAEATDAAYSDAGSVAELVVDGQSGDIDFPFANIKVLATVGEFDTNTGFMLVGVPDGMGVYLFDDSTVRVVFQSESYGPIGSVIPDSYPFIVNPDNGASFTGSHVMYVDYDRELLSEFLDSATSAAAPMVKGAGEVIQKAYNLRGQLVGKRNETCSEAPHFSNTDPNGCNIGWFEIMASDRAPDQADWLMQSLCSAHLEEKHQWGPGIGVEDTLFITNEEWTSYTTGSNYVGIPAHVIDLATYEAHATGVFTLGGFEKIVEVNCGVEGYVCFVPNGYNGDFGVDEEAEAQRAATAGKVRPDGTPYVFPTNVVPARLYIGKKGVDATNTPSTSFLARNGLAYGQLFGFATNVSATTGGLYQDAFSEVSPPGSKVEGAYYPIDWRWDGEVKQFLEDGSWTFQHKTADGTYFWTAAGPDESGAKSEHVTPDPYGGARVIQGSTAGFMGMYDFTGVGALITAADATGAFPTRIPATYTLLQGEQDITAQIMLGGKGVRADGGDQKTMVDDASVDESGNFVISSEKSTFEDIDGLEWYATSDSTDGYLLIQEDGGNAFGERTFLTKIMTDGTPMTFYFIAQSGGELNTRSAAGVGIPAGTSGGASSYEFSGSFDLTGLLAKDGAGEFIVKAGDDGTVKRDADKSTLINDKTIAFGLQAHSLTAGVINAFRGDRGGQVYAMHPQLP